MVVIRHQRWINVPEHAFCPCHLHLLPFFWRPVGVHTTFAGKKEMKTVFIVLLCCLSTFSLAAQPYLNDRSRHRFAQLNFGIDMRTFSNSEATGYSNATGDIKQKGLGSHTEGRLVVGGTHFWGHADFYIAFPFASIGNSGFRPNVETGAKIYPWRIEERKLRPYAGFSYLATSFQKGDGVMLLRNRIPVSAGLTFHYKRQLFDLGLTYNYNNTYNYYFTPTVQLPVKTPPLGISVGYKWMIETTLPAEADWKSGRTRALTDTLAKKHLLNGWTIAIAPSSAFFTRHSPANDRTPFIDQHKISNIFPEVGVGYYFHNPDIQTNLAYRKYKSTLSAYGYTQAASRLSVAVESYMFFGDYHGFSPFIGPALSYEKLQVSQSDPRGETTVEKTGIYPGVTFGWDIRPNRIQSFSIRGNFRYFPGLKVNMPSGGDIYFDALEVNFIQLVIFPGRMF